MIFCDDCIYFDSGVWGWCCELGYDPQLLAEDNVECPCHDDGVE